MDLRDALSQISEIRRHVAKAEVFRGYRSAPIAFSGVLAIGAAIYQALSLPDPAQNLESYFGLWIGAALLSMAVMGVALAWHCWRAASPMTTTMTLLAVGQFLPCVGAGGGLAFVLWHQAPGVLWMLPGLWAILFSLGIFASYRLLPSAIFWVGVYYLTAGICCLAWAQGDYAFSPWAMALPFGLGQLLTAGLLYWTLERPDLEPSDLEPSHAEIETGD